MLVLNEVPLCGWQFLGQFASSLPSWFTEKIPTRSNFRQLQYHNPASDDHISILINAEASFPWQWHKRWTQSRLRQDGPFFGESSHGEFHCGSKSVFLHAVVIPQVLCNFPRESPGFEVVSIPWLVDWLYKHLWVHLWTMEAPQAHPHVGEWRELFQYAETLESLGL